MRSIGEAARKEVEAFLGTRVFLELWVNCGKKLDPKPPSLESIGLSTHFNPLS